MPITILAPRGTPSRPKLAQRPSDSDSDSDGGVDIEGDVSMSRPAKRPRGDNYEIVTPGEVITDDPQWMRFVQRRLPSPVPLFTASVHF